MKIIAKTVNYGELSRDLSNPKFCQNTLNPCSGIREDYILFQNSGLCMSSFCNAEMVRWIKDLNKFVTTVMNPSCIADSDKQKEAMNDYYRKFDVHNVSSDYIRIDFTSEKKHEGVADVIKTRHSYFNMTNNLHPHYQETMLFYSIDKEYGVKLHEELFLVWKDMRDYNESFYNIMKCLEVLK